MNTISLCRKVPELPEVITRELLIVQMSALEQHLMACNPLFEPDLYMAIMDKLAGIYWRVNHSNCGKYVVKGSLVSAWEVPERIERLGLRKLKY